MKPIALPMPKLVPHLTVLLVLAMVFLPVAHATQWKWLDAQGKVQYSDRPPPGDVPDKNILKRPASQSTVARSTPPAATSSSAVSGNGKDPELEKKKREQDASEDAKAKAAEERQAQKRAESCEKARKYERALDQGLRVVRSNDKGEREFLDEKGVAEERARTRQVINSDCR